MSEHVYSTGVCMYHLKGFEYPQMAGSRKTGSLTLYLDSPGVWKWKICDITAKKERPVLNFKIINDYIKDITLNVCRLTIKYKNTTFYFDKAGEYANSELLQKMKTIKSILDALKMCKDPLKILCKTPKKDYGFGSPRGTSSPGVRLQARDVADMLSSESGDDSVLFNEPSDVWRRSYKSPATGRRDPHSRGTKMVNAARRSLDNKENSLASSSKGSCSEDEKAGSFYGSPAASSRTSASSLMESIRSLPRDNVRLAPAKTLSYSMKKPGLLPSPIPLGRSSTTPLKQSSITTFASPTLQGFANIGNTCYLNASLQSLLGMKPFEWDMFSNLPAHKSLKQTGLYIPLMRLGRLKNTGSKNTENMEQVLKSVKSAISSSAKRFSGFEQHDAHEFLAQVLDQLSDEVQLAEKLEANEHRWINPTVTNFETEVLHSIACECCGAKVTKTEQLYDFGVEMPPRNNGQPGSIQQALDTFLKPETLEYKCEHCGHGQSQVSHLITRLPRILVVHLKRYSYDSEIQSHSKLGRPVFIPRYITVDGNCDHHTIPARTPDNPELARCILELARRQAEGGDRNNNDEKLEDNKSEDEDDLAVVPQVKTPQPSPSVGSSPTSHQADDLDRTDGLPDLEHRSSTRTTPTRKYTFTPTQKSSPTDLNRTIPDDADDLDRILELSKREFQEEEKMRNSVGMLDEDEQLKLALERSVHETSSQQFLPPANAWLLESPEKSSSLDSDLEKVSVSDRWKLPPPLSRSILNDNSPAKKQNPSPPKLSNSSQSRLSTPNKKPDLKFMDASSPLATKRRRLLHCTPNKQRKTEEPRLLVVESSDEGSPDQNNEDIFRRLSGSKKTTVGLKGGAKPLGDSSDDDGSKKCRDCNCTKAECSCESDDALILSTSFETDNKTTPTRSKTTPPKPKTTPIQQTNSKLFSTYKDVKIEKEPVDNTDTKSVDNVSLVSECMCDFYSDRDKNKWCHACNIKSRPRPVVESRDSKKPSTPAERTKTFSRLALRREGPPRFQRKCDVEDSLEWVMKTTAKLDEKKSENKDNDDDDFDDYLRYKKQMDAARQASLDEAKKNKLSNLTEEEQFNRALQASLLENNPPNKPHDLDDEFEKAVQASLLETGQPDDENPLPRTKTYANNIKHDISADDELSDAADITLTLDNADTNCENGHLPHSFDLVGVVSHLGSTATFGHYIADVYDAKKGEWRSYDDRTVTSTTLREVRQNRRKNGYVFFYMAKEVLKEVESQLNHPLLKKKEKNGTKSGEKLRERSPNVVKKRSPNERKFNFTTSFS